MIVSVIRGTTVLWFYTDSVAALAVNCLGETKNWFKWFLLEFYHKEDVEFYKEACICEL